MAMMLEVLASAAPGDWLLAVLTSLAASVALNWYYIEEEGSLRITTPDGWIAFSAMLVTGLAGSAMAVRARRRAREAEEHSADMERLQRLGHALLSRNSLLESAEHAVKQVAELFGASGVEVVIEGMRNPVRTGNCDDQNLAARVSLDLLSPKSELALFGAGVSGLTLDAIGQLIGLALGRARSHEELSRIDVERRGEELRAVVLNGLAHNFRTPLTSIKAAASALRATAWLTENAGKELGEIIEEEADRLDRLIGESLRFARIESHTVNPRWEECSLAQVTSKVVMRLAGHLRGRELVVDVSESLPSIKGDRFLLEQMVFEVVDNAWKYSRPGSRVSIEGTTEGSSVVLTVRTQGDEIADNERDLIFAKFYRGAVHRSSIEGTGVGLAVARAIVDAHRGSIRLDSEPGGQAFRFSLPSGK
jgi:two-component system sensor histidine kinase KdpD